MKSTLVKIFSGSLLVFSSTVGAMQTEETLQCTLEVHPAHGSCGEQQGDGTLLLKNGSGSLSTSELCPNAQNIRAGVDVVDGVIVKASIVVVNPLGVQPETETNSRPSKTRYVLESRVEELKTKSIVLNARDNTAGMAATFRKSVLNCTITTP